jgi:hypothetical protein
MIRILATLFVLIIGENASAQPPKVFVTVYMDHKRTNPKSDTIYHDVARRLTWDDFKGKPDYNHFGGAVTSSGYAFNADIVMENMKLYLNVNVYTFFTKSRSWKKPNITTDYHLQHEQLHFDITRLGAENFVKELSKANFTKDNYNKVLNEVFDRTYAQTIAMQKAYDLETKHSINTEHQLRWNAKIKEELSKLQPVK